MQYKDCKKSYHFTLIEVLISMAILGLSIYSISAGIVASRKANLQNKYTLEAEMLAFNFAKRASTFSYDTLVDKLSENAVLFSGTIPGSGQIDISAIEGFVNVIDLTPNYDLDNSRYRITGELADDPKVKNSGEDNYDTLIVTAIITLQPNDPGLSQVTVEASSSAYVHSY